MSSDYPGSTVCIGSVSHVIRYRESEVGHLPEGMVLGQFSSNLGHLPVGVLFFEGTRLGLFKEKPKGIQSHFGRVSLSCWT